MTTTMTTRTRTITMHATITQKTNLNYTYVDKHWPKPPPSHLHVGRVSIHLVLGVVFGMNGILIHSVCVFIRNVSLFSFQCCR